MNKTKTPLTFRIATIADTKDIQVLINTAFSGAGRAAWTSETHLQNSNRIDEAGIHMRINQDGGLILLAHEISSGSLVGCCYVERRGGGLGYFGLLSVDPGRQTAGVGKMVLAEVEDIARDTLGVRRLEGRVIWPRGEMIDWYVRRGYTKTNRTEEYPYAEVGRREGLRDDLYFVILEKQLC